MNKFLPSTILNLGSLATFIAFPFLYSAMYTDNPPLLWAGVALTASAMIAPFIAQKAAKKEYHQEQKQS